MSARHTAGRQMDDIKTDILDRCRRLARRVADGCCSTWPAVAFLSFRDRWRLPSHVGAAGGTAHLSTSAAQTVARETRWARAVSALSKGSGGGSVRASASEVQPGEANNRSEGPEHARA